MNDTIKELKARQTRIEERRNAARNKEAVLEKLFAPLRKAFLDAKDLPLVKRVQADDLNCRNSFSPTIQCDATSFKLRSETDPLRVVFSLTAQYIGADEDIPVLTLSAEFPAHDYVGNREYQSLRARGLTVNEATALSELLDVLAVCKVITPEE